MTRTVTFLQSVGLDGDHRMRGRAVRRTRVKVSCPRCRGHIGLVDSFASHIFAFHCLDCGRENQGHIVLRRLREVCGLSPLPPDRDDSEVALVTLRDDFGVPEATLNQAAWNEWTPCWVLVPAEGAS